MTHPTHRSRFAPVRPQKGAALIVTVLLMMVISLLALTAMMRNNLDERMAFNQRDRQVALQAAEAALREAEDAVRARFGITLDESFFFGRNDCTQADGWCQPNTPEQGWAGLNDAAWSNGSTATLALSTRSSMTNVSAQPRYIIEYQGSEKIAASLFCVARFLITARALGRNANSIVTLQSQYRLRVGSCGSGI